MPAIPIKVFAPVGTKIRGLHHQTTLFLHTQGQPKVTLKLKKLPSPAPGTARTTAEVRLRWGLALMIDSQEALGSAINLAQINQALRTHFTDQTPFTTDPYLPLLLSNRRGETAEGIFDINRHNWLAKSGLAKNPGGSMLYTPEGTTLSTVAAQVEYDGEGIYFRCLLTLIQDSDQRPLVQIGYHDYGLRPQEQDRYQQLTVYFNDSEAYRLNALDKRSFLQQLEDGDLDGLLPLVSCLQKLNPAQSVHVIDTVRKKGARFDWHSQPDVAADPVLFALESDHYFADGIANNTYHYRLGDGHTVIQDSGGVDILVLLGEITEEALALQRTGDDLQLIIYRDVKEAGIITLKNHFTVSSARMENIMVDERNYNITRLLQGRLTLSGKNSGAITRMPFEHHLLDYSNNLSEHGEGNSLYLLTPDSKGYYAINDADGVDMLELPENIRRNDVCWQKREMTWSSASAYLIILSLSGCKTILRPLGIGWSKSGYRTLFIAFMIVVSLFLVGRAREKVINLKR
ncbi:hypothetical protein CCS41_08150 [Candidatus Fukatsuia symbiotica]|uniref:Uncharacterized protein n=1 Tax=Candidatus Fukatsuia symbiotica TaxID=1878942 RepID=A0A2U8I5L8_9GAMM|nr:hypothetical protein [Candidatus Fukatsuia symbiotica]AWK14453.1 hypothetical protein CCS41_08150 [Candidatus Fukatsuia symbiotica]